MPEKVAIIGSREGADQAEVHAFVRALWEKYPDTILVSGGARGVDEWAEQEWLRLGGRVESYRPVPLMSGSIGIEKWELGGQQPRVFKMLEEPTFEDFKSAALWRDIIVADEADRLVAFFAPGGSRGAGFTAQLAEDSGKHVYRYEKEAA